MPRLVQATGVNPAETILPRYLNVYALPASVVGRCPATFQSALQITDASRAQGADTVALAVPETTDAAGAFAMPVANAPAAAGAFILCGYTHDLVETYAVRVARRHGERVARRTAGRGRGRQAGGTRSSRSWCAPERGPPAAAERGRTHPRATATPGP